MRGRVIKRWFVAVALCAGAGAACLGQETSARADEKLERILKGVGESVERYHAGLFSIRFTETWRREELSKEFKPKKTREFVFDDFVVREDSPHEEGFYFGKIIRRLRSVDGKPARAGKRESDEPEPTSYSFLTFLLPSRQKELVFTFEGEESCGGRRCFRLGHRPRQQVAAGAVWKGSRFWVYGPMAGRVWVDAENSDVLALELRLTEEFEFKSPRTYGAILRGRFGPARKLRYVRQELTVRFRRVEFKDPAQTLLLPESSEWLRVIEGASRPRIRITQTFTDYQRFVSDVKVIEDAEPENF